MTGEQQRAAAAARWAALSPAERRAATEAARAAAAEARAKAAAKRAKREAKRQAAQDRVTLDAVRPDTLAEARRIAGPAATDHELAQQCLLVIKARRAGDVLTPTERTRDADRPDEEGAERANARPQEARGHRPGQGNA